MDLTKNRDDLGKLEELASLENQVKDLQVHDKLGKHKFHEDEKNLYEALTSTINDACRDISKIITESSIKNSPAISDQNEKVLELMKERV